VFILSMTATTSLEAIAAEVPEARRWFQLYMQSDRGLTRELCRRAAAAGYEALCVTVDAPVVARMRRFEGGVFAVPPDLPLPNLDVADPGREDRVLGKLVAGFDAAVTFDDLASFREWSGLPVVVKGVVRGDDARRCIDSGASAVSVSNHGGRQLGHCVATARALPWVVDAVDGQGEVYVDGGIRSGTDIVKALALGARAVLIGRPILWGLATDGEQGARAVIGELTDQLGRAMAYCGACHPQDVSPDLLGPRPIGGRGL
jgi:4-hydroxymandelate oxidase